MTLQNKSLVHTCNARTALLIWVHEAGETSGVKVSGIFFFLADLCISLSQVPSNTQLHKERRLSLHICKQCHLHTYNYIMVVYKHGGGITQYYILSSVEKPAYHELSPALLSLCKTLLSQIQGVTIFCWTKAEIARLSRGKLWLAECLTQDPGEG